MPAKRLLKLIYLFIRTRFSLHKDKENEHAIVESIRRGIVFRGINVWILVFAVFLASIGLNVNSTAVIIGAMLISPLMGPIMGLGLGLGIFDFDLVKAAARNLAIMVGVSLATSTLYFALSPLSQAQSELLARTHPTIWDVLIALFGGLAGIVAGSSKEKGTVIPGVAIATALMPPLCTAGFGLATGNFTFFIGAFYLFCINCVFISVSTLVVVRLLKFSKRTFVDKRREMRIRNTISVIVLITVVPSIFIAYLTVRKAMFEQRAHEFIRNEFYFDKTVVLTRGVDYENDRIDLVLIGEPVPEDTIVHRKDRMGAYGLDETMVQVTQGFSDTIDEALLKSDILREAYSRNEKVLSEKDKVIIALRRELEGYKKQTLPVKAIARELKTLNPDILALSVQHNAYFNIQENKTDTVTIAYAKFGKRPPAAEQEKLEGWLKARTQADTLRFVVE